MRRWRPAEKHTTRCAGIRREILTDDRLIDRQQLGALVFGSPERLARLNALVHPSVVRREEESIAEFAAREPRASRCRGGHPHRDGQL